MPSETSVAAAAEKIARPVLEENGYELVDVEYVKQGREWYLNVYIHKEGGVTIDDCEAMSQILDPLMDADPAVAGRPDYFCVSSPGLDRPFKKTADWLRFLGKEVEVKLFAPLEGKKEFEGVLKEADDDRVVLKAGNREYGIDRQAVALARPHVSFESEDMEE